MDVQMGGRENLLKKIARWNKQAALPKSDELCLL